MENVQIIWLQTLGDGYLYFVCVGSVHSVKVAPKSHWLPNFTFYIILCMSHTHYEGVGDQELPPSALIRYICPCNQVL